MKTRTLPAYVTLAALLAAPAAAEQYKSEVRELPGAPAAAQPQDAEKLLQSTTDPYARALLLRDLAAKAVNEKDYTKAAKYLEEAIAQKSLSGVALEQMRQNLTQLYVASGKPEAVIKALEPTVKNNPRAPAEQQAALAGAYIELKRFKEALPLIQRAVAATPNPDESWLQALYAAQVEAGQQREAIPTLERLLRLNPQRREYWIQLAGLQLKAGNKERALALLELASRQGHLDSADQRLQIVSLTAQLGAPFEAGSLMQSWMESDQIPRTAQNWEALAGLWVDAREWTLATAALDQALQGSQNAELYLQLGQLQMARKAYDEAASALNEGIKRGAGSASALLALGVSAYNAGNVDGARQAFEGIARYKPSKANEQAAQEWLKFLDTEAAREQSRRAAEENRREQAAQQVAISGRLSGDTVSLQPQLSGATGGAQEFRKFSGRLTPVGAEQDASADGSIPEWTGGLLKAQWPSAFKPGERLADPYAQDKPLFTITAANAAQYAGLLTSSHKQLLAKYPSYKLPVYPTRRSVAFPQAIYDATQANAGRAKLIGSDSLQGAKLGFPFPQPQNGVEVMWNHRVRYRGDTVVGQFTEGVVGPRGVIRQQKAMYRVYFRYANVKEPVDIAQDNILVQGVTWFGKEVRERPEFVVLFHETADSIKKARGIWVLMGDFGKMFRIPPVGYDQPLYGSEGLFFIDMIDMYNGAFDRYVWKLVGKREMIVPYNSFRLNDGHLKNAQLMTPNHFNQEPARYEKHRVWVVEATERGGKRHIFGKRVFYVDEDTWNVLLVENHDRQERLWRFQEGHLLPFYDAQNANTFPIVTYDLRDGRYFVQRLLNDDPPVRFDVAMDEQDYLPAVVKNRYSR